MLIEQMTKKPRRARRLRKIVVCGWRISQFRLEGSRYDKHWLVSREVPGRIRGWCDYLHRDGSVSNAVLVDGKGLQSSGYHTTMAGACAAARLHPVDTEK